VVPSESKYELLKTKVEIRLKKSALLSWPTLERSEKKIAANFSDPANQQPPSYPSSFTKCASCPFCLKCSATFSTCMLAARGPYRARIEGQCMNVGPGAAR
jgi:hypothetical protein